LKTWKKELSKPINESELQSVHSKNRLIFSNASFLTLVSVKTDDRI
jgi:hypothetical protein